MSTRDSPPFVYRRGPLTWREAGAFRRFLLRPSTTENFAHFGAEMALNMLDARGAFGCTIPTAIRRGWWQRLLEYSVFIGTLANPDAPALATAEGRAFTEQEARRCLMRFAAFHEARVVPFILMTPVPGPPRQPGTSIIQLPGQRSRRDDDGNDEGGGAPLGAA